MEEIIEDLKELRSSSNRLGSYELSVINDTIRKLEKNQTNLKLNALGFLICNDDLEEASKILEEVDEDGPVPDEIMVSEQFENESLNSLLSLWENLIETFKN